MNLNISALLRHLEVRGFNYDERYIREVYERAGISGVADYFASISIHPSMLDRFIVKEKREVVSKFKEENKKYLTDLKGLKSKKANRLSMATVSSAMSPSAPLTWTATSNEFLVLNDEVDDSEEIA